MTSTYREKGVLCLHVVLLLAYTLTVTGQGAAKGSDQSGSDPGEQLGAPGSGGVPATQPIPPQQPISSEVFGTATSGIGVPIIGDITYLVSLRRRSDLGYFCSGVLIGNRHVLTAAHCVDSSISSADSWPQVVVGSASSSKTSGRGVQVISTQNVVIHPAYRGGRLNNLAIVELSSAARQSPIRIITRLRLRRHMRNGNLLTSLGWGRQGQDSGFPETAQVVSVKFIDRRRCVAELGRPTSSSEICMGGQGAGSCPGDDGGPIVVQGDTRSDAILVGIVGSSHVCGSSRTPDVHTSVAPFIDWIKSTAGLP